MNRRARILILFALLLTLMALPLIARLHREKQISKTHNARVQADYGKLPLSFEANQGQVAKDIKFLSRGIRSNFYLSSDEAVLELPGEKKSQPTSLRMKLKGTNKRSQLRGEEELPGKSNYFIGNDPKKWQTNVTNYAKVKYEEIYPGIDLVYYGNQQQLEYDFVVQPGADPQAIKMKLEGARKIELDDKGDLVIEINGKEVRQFKPVIYQEVDGARQEIAGNYVINGQNEFGFELGAYDTSKPLIIDPVLSYSTYLHGLTSADSIAVDIWGNAYITGEAYLSTLEVTPGAVRPDDSSKSFVAVVKLNPAGTACIYSALIGGTFGSGQIGKGISI
ncbi:MAG TPA: hypothetical protein VEF04_19885, partial [Blastocatellia bacterium]|nr:hypothetical protein [Blastocatellia bacterium]